MNKIKIKTMAAPLILWMIVTMACVQPLAGLLGTSDEVERDPAVIAQATVELRTDVRSMLGDLEADRATVEIPQHTFDRDTTLTMAYLGDPPGDGAAQFTPLGPTVALKVEGEQTRFNEPVSISLKFDPGMVNGPGDVYAAYYDEVYGWHYFVPDEVDMERGVMHFTTYHFSRFTATKPSDDEIIDQFVTNQSTEQFVRHTQQHLVDDKVEEMVREIMREGMGVTDNRTIAIITRAVLKEAPLGIGKIGIAIHDNKPDDVFNVTLEETAKALGKALKEGKVADIAGEASTVAAFAGAAGAYSEGDYEGALKIMANEIADNIPLVSTIKKTGEAVAEVYDHWIQDLWKTPGLNKAYEVYATGKDKYGYRGVEAGVFDGVLNQMGGLARQLRLDYVKSYCAQRGCDPNRLTEQERKTIADRGIDLIRQQWEARYEREAEIKQIKENNMKLIEMYRNRGLLDLNELNPMYTEHDDLEMLLSRLNRMTLKVMRDTGRSSFVTHSYDYRYPDRQLWGPDIADLVLIWYENQPNSDEAYQQALVELGLIEAEEVVVEEEQVEAELLITAIQFEISGEYLVDPSDDEEFDNCPPGKARFTFRLWNVGELGGKEYGEVEVVNAEFPAFFYNESSGKCTTRDYHTGIQGDLTFSGGPNGIIYWGRQEAAQFVNGRYLVFGDIEIPVPDPSVFDGF